MQTTSKDLRFNTKEILDVAKRGEEVIITYHGKPYVKIIPISSPGKSQEKDKQNDFCGIWKERAELKDVNKYVRNLRKGRNF